MNIDCDLHYAFPNDSGVSLLFSCARSFLSCRRQVFPYCSQTSSETKMMTEAAAFHSHREPPPTTCNMCSFRSSMCAIKTFITCLGARQKRGNNDSLKKAALLLLYTTVRTCTACVYTVYAQQASVCPIPTVFHYMLVHNRPTALPKRNDMRRPHPSTSLVMNT